MNKKISRRNLLKIGAAAGIGLATTPLWAFAQTPPPPKLPYILPHKVKPADRQAAADRAKALGLKPGAAMQPAVMTPGGFPHYWGPYANYANSPAPKGGIGSITVDEGGSGYTAPIVTISDVWGTGINATATATVASGVITSITINTAGSGYSAPVVMISDTGPGTGAAATANLGGLLSGGLKKFVDSLAGINPATPNTLNQWIPVAIPDKLAYPGSDYYEIAVGEFSQKFHRDLDPTKLRGYRQVNTNDTNINTFHYLGPIIVCDRDTPVRVKFINQLPAGTPGNLFVPVDETVMGAGEGPIAGEKYAQNRATIHNHGALTPWISDGTPHQWTAPAGQATSWPKGVSTGYVPDMWFDPTTGARVSAGTPGATNNPGAGAMTFYYTNQQSARLMFYHDHAYGITRLNVYVGEAGPYLIMDDVEKDLIGGTNISGVNPGLVKALPDIGIPLVIQDKTFVDATTIPAQDPTWQWGSAPGPTGHPVTGDLWVPSVYMPAQNPWDPTGASAFGRWQLGTYFWPPVVPLANPAMEANPYAGQNPWEAPLVPVLPRPSMGMEAFNDTPTVNGVAYPHLDLEPKAYRFRILNAANDRFFNLQFYVADPDVVTDDGRTNTEVKMVPAMATPGFPPTWSTDGRMGGVPDPATAGPSWIQIGTEGGFLPEPVVIPPQPVNWNMNALAFNVGNVTDHSLLLGCAERADVLVDFSQFAGKTLIMYNDAPAAFPAYNPQYDYYTSAPDNTSTGGAPTTQPGYGPNTRIIMQINVGSGNAAGLGVANINLTAGGSDYDSMPEVIIDGGGGTGATATAIGGMLDHVQVFSPGAGYTSAPTVGFVGDGTGAAATAIVKAGKVTSIVVTNRGTGFTLAPTVTLTGGGASTVATAGALLTITAIQLDTPGSGYTSTPSVYLAGGGGYGATAVAVFAAGTGYDLTTLNGIFAKSASKRGVFEVSQDPIILPQAAYNSAYNTSFPTDNSQYILLQEFSKTFTSHILAGLTLTSGGSGYSGPATVTITASNGVGSGATATATVTNGVVTGLTLTNPGNGYTAAPLVTITGGTTNALASATLATVVMPEFEPKAIHDEMSAAYDPEYGRMSGLLGLELKKVNSLNQNLVLYGYASPPTDIFKNSMTPLGTLQDGTQIWKITQNGVDTHPIHFHLVNVQLINRVGWDNALLPPEPNEIGWKETVRVNPLEHCIVAMRPVAPVLPFDLPNSVRLIDVTKPEGVELMGVPAGFIDPGGTGTVVMNHKVNFGWEYVWHCHILSHEEMDMMHSLNLAVAPKAPTGLVGNLIASPRSVVLTWANPALNATHFVVERSTNAAFTANFISFKTAGLVLTYTDSTIAADTRYYYRVKGANTVGDTTVYVAPAIGYPTETAIGNPSNVVSLGGVTTVPAAPSNLSAVRTTPTRITLTWQDNASNETNFTVQRKTSAGGAWVNVTTTVAAKTGTGGVVTYSNTPVSSVTQYWYQVLARNASGNSLPSNVFGPL